MVEETLKTGRSSSSDNKTSNPGSKKNARFKGGKRGNSRKGGN